MPCSLSKNKTDTCSVQRLTSRMINAGNPLQRPRMPFFLTMLSVQGGVRMPESVGLGSAEKEHMPARH